jgi:hypothetical protein
MKDHRVRPASCPHCEKVLDGALTWIGDDDRGPAPNDATVCINCGTILIYTDDLRLRLATALEIAEVAEALSA